MKKLTALQVFGFILLGAFLCLGLMLLFPFTGKNFENNFWPSVLKIIFSTVFVGIGILFLSPSRSTGEGLSTSLHDENIRWKWLLSAFAGALTIGVIAIITG